MISVSGKTRVLGIIGNPVGHSLSPVMQNAAIRACRLDYVYVPFMVPPDALGTAVAGLRALGVYGFNVTIPHKTEIIRYLDHLDESAADAGAVNTVLVRDGRMTGFNTDGYGLLSSLSEDLDFSAGAGAIVVIGAGGAARAAVSALCRAGAEHIVISNRSFQKAGDLQRDMSRIYPAARIDVIGLEQISRSDLSSVSLLINTTSLGMYGETIPAFADLSVLPETAKVYDMVYSPAETPLLRESVSRGMNAANGLGMLAAQGERAFTIWTGEIPPKGLMLGVLRGICRN